MHQDEFNYRSKSNSAVFLTAAILFFAFVTSISAKTLSAYRADIKRGSTSMWCARPAGHNNHDGFFFIV